MDTLAAVALIGLAGLVCLGAGRMWYRIRRTLWCSLLIGGLEWGIVTMSGPLLAALHQVSGTGTWPVGDGVCLAVCVGIAFLGGVVWEGDAAAQREQNAGAG